MREFKRPGGCLLSPDDDQQDAQPRSVRLGRGANLDGPMDKLLVIVFSSAWFGVEAFNQIQQRKRRDSTASPADRGSLVLLYVCIAIGYTVAIAVSFAPLGRLPREQPLWLVAGAVLIACGLWIRHLAMQTLASFFTYQVEIQAAHRLV